MRTPDGFGPRYTASVEGLLSAMGRIRRGLRWVLRGREHGIRARLRARICGRRSPESEPERVPEPAPDGFVEVARLDELADGEVAEFIAGGVPVAVARVGGRCFAMSNTCPHAGGPIGDGEVVDGRVECPLHGWAFDLETGACDVDPTLALRIFPVRIRRGHIEVDATTG